VQTCSRQNRVLVRAGIVNLMVPSRSRVRVLVACTAAQSTKQLHCRWCSNTGSAKLACCHKAQRQCRCMNPTVRQ
jgi:hypothetical protein